MKKSIVSCLLIVSMIMGLAMFSVTSNAEDNTIKYDKMDMSSYWEDRKAPVKSGYVFGGWYTSQDEQKYTALKEADIEKNEISEGNVYAKFVPANVLSVKTVVEKAAEVPSNSVDKPAKTVLRILSAVDCKEYRSVGFEIYFADRTIPETTPETTKVFSGLKLKEDGDTITPEEIFGAPADYFIALDVDSVQQSSFSKNVYARPYWVTMDGTKVMGLAKNIRVEDKYSDYRYLSVPINLLTDGANPVGVAAGKVTMTYDATKFTVAKEDDTYRIDTGRLLKEMGYKVQEENGVGTITFIGNGIDKNTAITADGLFANVRFQRLDNTATTTEADLNLTKTSVEFCDWSETPKTVDVW